MPMRLSPDLLALTDATSKTGSPAWAASPGMLGKLTTTMAATPAATRRRARMVIGLYVKRPGWVHFTDFDTARTTKVSWGWPRLPWPFPLACPADTSTSDG